MKTKTIYECEICGKISVNKDSIQRCENKGRFNIESAPKYVMIQQDFYKNITFCVITYEKFNNHFGEPILWACRDNGYGDSLGKEKCYRQHLIKNSEYFSEYDAVKDFKSDHFKRMVKYLRENNLPVQYWDGKEIKLYNELTVSQ